LCLETEVESLLGRGDAGVDHRTRAPRAGTRRSTTGSLAGRVEAFPQCVSGSELPTWSWGLLPRRRGPALRMRASTRHGRNSRDRQGSSCRSSHLGTGAPKPPAYPIGRAVYDAWPSSPDSGEWQASAVLIEVDRDRRDRLYLVAQGLQFDVAVGTAGR
jgi:hypothetical protein